MSEIMGRINFPHAAHCIKSITRYFDETFGRYVIPDVIEYFSDELYLQINSIMNNIKKY